MWLRQIRAQVKKTEPHYTLISSFMQALIKRQSFLRLFVTPLLFAPVDANEMLKSARLHMYAKSDTHRKREMHFLQVDTLNY
jgi:hypothetical protein